MGPLGGADLSEAQIAVNRGSKFHVKGRHEKAIESYDKAVQLDPDYAIAYYYRAGAYSEIGQYQSALKDINRCIELESDDSDADDYCVRGAIYFGLGELELALADYDKAITLNPDDASAYYGRGDTYRKLGQTANADVDFSKACELDPKFC